jgi:hypothetical protein
MTKLLTETEAQLAAEGAYILAFEGQFLSAARNWFERIHTQIENIAGAFSDRK